MENYKSANCGHQALERETYQERDKTTVCHYCKQREYVEKRRRAPAGLLGFLFLIGTILIPAAPLVWFFTDGTSALVTMAIGMVTMIGTGAVYTQIVDMLVLEAKEKYPLENQI